VTVECDAGTVRADAVVIAIPPQHRSAITFTPDLPADYRRLTQAWPQGRLSKAYAAYDTAFWRANGHSGAALSDTGPVFITFDVSPISPAGADGPGVLLGFVDAREFDALAPEQRRDQALAGFAALFGKQALTPLDYLDYRWGTEQFAPDGPTAAVPPGSWTSVGVVLRRPVGPIFWAGTETADEWTGFLDGAVRSGQRAATEVDNRFTRP
jgi:monoamine oxidase